MTHALETGDVNRLHLSGNNFWYVCRANLGPDSSGTRFRRRLVRCSIPSQEVTEMMASDWSMIIVDVFKCCEVVGYSVLICLFNTFSRVYFQHQKFSYQTHTERKTGAGKLESMVPVSGVCIMHKIGMN